MSTATKIEWTRSDDGSAGATWNPVTGCTEVSEGCDRCYAKTFAERFRGVPGHPFEQGFDAKLWPARLRLPLTLAEVSQGLPEQHVGPLARQRSGRVRRGGVGHDVLDFQRGSAAGALVQP